MRDSHASQGRGATLLASARAASGPERKEFKVKKRVNPELNLEFTEYRVLTFFIHFLFKKAQLIYF